MIEVYIFRTLPCGNVSELVAVIPLEKLSSWIDDYNFDVSSTYQLHFTKDEKIVKNI